MAYLKIFPIKVTDKKALDYITNPDKTDEKLLVSSFGCSPETADLEFSMTREMAKKNGMDKGDNLAFHLMNDSVSRKSASTRHEYNILINVPSEKSIFLSSLNLIGSVSRSGISTSSL